MTRRTQETIGNLLRQAGPNPKTVISAFSEKEDSSKNEKALSKFLVPMLEETAEFLKIDIVDHEGKKIFVKNSLTKTIVRKLSAHLPSNDTLNHNRQCDLPKPKICNLYKKGACPHGLKGTKLIEGGICKFDHPAACQRYISYGSRDI